MISVEEAKRIMMAHVRLSPTSPAWLDNADRLFLADDVLARYPYPLFDMSAVDGYAVRGAGPWKIVGQVAAGEVLERALALGEAARIFTGAQVPEGTEAVLMQERCAVNWTSVSLAGLLTPGSNIRRQEEGHRKGDLLFSKGQRIDPVVIGMLAGDGLEQVPVHDMVNVGIICTGGEFTARGREPASGSIFSSNELLLERALVREHAHIADGARTVIDDKQEIRKAFEQELKSNEVIITTGGASVGEHDLIETVLQEMGASIHFHGVAQKPGKPMLFAELDGKPIFGLPGNPRAVMILFWEYVLPFLRAMQGATDPWLKNERLPITHAVELKGERAEFRAAQVRVGKVTLLADEGSHMLRSLVDADALAYFPADSRSFKEGDQVEIHYLPR